MRGLLGHHQVNLAGQCDFTLQGMMNEHGEDLIDIFNQPLDPSGWDITDICISKVKLYKYGDYVIKLNSILEKLPEIMKTNTNIKIVESPVGCALTPRSDQKLGQSESLVESFATLYSPSRKHILNEWL